MFHSEEQKKKALCEGIGASIPMATQKMAFDAGYALGRTTAHTFTAEEFKKIQSVLEDGKWNWGGFAQAMGQLLRKADFGNAQKLARGFENEFLGWLDCYGR